MKPCLFSLFVLLFIGKVFSQPVFDEVKLTALDGTGLDEFGIAVDIDGDLAIVGAWQDNPNGSASGAAYIFRHEGSTWTQMAKLIPEDGGADDRFGVAVGISGDYAVIGAYHDDDGGEEAGAAYVFNLDGDGVSWNQHAKLTANDSEGFDLFGISVAISGNYIVAGATEDRYAGRGKAYVFQRFGSSWTQRSRLVAGDGDNDDQFGVSVAITDSNLVVGAWRDVIDGNSWQGAAYFYEITNLGGWIEVEKVTAGDGDDFDLFGISVGISGNRAIIGARDDEPGGLLSGSAYFFRRENGAWTQTARVVPNDNDPAGDKFGNAVAMDGDWAVVAANEDENNGASSGAIYLYKANETNPGSWFQYAEIDPGDASEFDQFGQSVAISDGVVIAGANLADAGAHLDAGAAYVFTDSLALPINGTADQRPQSFELYQNFPNPFNPATVIRYSLFVNSSVMLDIYNLSGERIRQLVGRSGVPAANQPAGPQSVTWDGTNDAGVQVASGVYFYRLAVKSATRNAQSAMGRSAMEKTRKMILIR